MGELAERVERCLATHRPVLLDVAYNPWPSVLASAWEANGGTVVSGPEMLLYQAVEQVLIFTDRTLSEGELLGLVNAMCAAVDLASRAPFREKKACFHSLSKQAFYTLFIHVKNYYSFLLRCGAGAMKRG